MLRRLADALRTHQRYVQLAPTRANAHDSLGLSYHVAGRHADAEQSFHRAIELAPGFEVAFVHLGNLYFHMGRYRDAVAMYDRYIAAADFDTDRGRGYICKAWVAFQRGDQSMAWRDTERAAALAGVMIGPDYIEIALVNDPARATRWLNAIPPNLWLSRGARASIRFEHIFSGQRAQLAGDTEAALGHFARAVASGPPYYLIEWYDDVLAQAYARAGRYDDAIKEFDRVLEITPHLAHVRFRFAQLLDRAGHHARAGAEYRTFLDAWRHADADLPALRVARERAAALASSGH